jgi:4-hydroxybenzoate polyprenyltransferase
MVSRGMAEFPSTSGRREGGVPWGALANLIRLRSQTGTALLLLPSLWALTLAAQGAPPPSLVVIFLAGSFLMRSAGVILNDLADRSFDRQVARTKSRPLASGQISPGHAAALLAVLLLAAAALVLLLDPSVWMLAPVAVALAWLYPFSKRWLDIPQAMLGVAFGWGAVMAWAAVRGRVEAPGWLLFSATIFWAVAYDTIYALQDQEDDRRIGVKSSALLFGSFTWLAVAGSLSSMLLLLAAAGREMGIGWPFYAALGAVALLFAWQSLRLRRTVDPRQAFAMFRAHVWYGMVILLGVIAGYRLA